MPKTWTYFDKVEIRRRTTVGGAWDTSISPDNTGYVVLDNDAISPFVFTSSPQHSYYNAGGGLKSGYEYELRITRSRPGMQTLTRDGSDGPVYIVADGASLPSGGATVKGSGTYNLSLGNQTISVTRQNQNPSLVLDLKQNNWVYVAVHYQKIVSGVVTDYYKAVRNKNTWNWTIGSDTYTADTSVIADASNIVSIKLDSGIPMDVFVDYAGSSSGKFTILSL